MATLEARRALDLADDDSRDHADQDEQCEDVDQQRVPALRAEPRQGRMCVDGADHGDDDRGEQDDEAPEDRGMHQARQQVLQQLPLADHIGGLDPGAGGHVIEAGRGLARPN